MCLSIKSIRVITSGLSSTAATMSSTFCNIPATVHGSYSTRTMSLSTKVTDKNGSRYNPRSIHHNVPSSWRQTMTMSVYNYLNPNPNRDVMIESTSILFFDRQGNRLEAEYDHWTNSWEVYSIPYPLIYDNRIAVIKQ